MNTMKDDDRSTMVRQLGTIDADPETGPITAEELFSMVDKDGSGTITRQEFVAFHKELKDSMRLEHRKEALLMEDGERAMTSARKAKRRNRMLCTILAVLGVVMIILIGANASLTYSVVEYTKETNAIGSGVLKVKDSDEIAKTAEATVAVPLILAPHLPEDSMQALKKVMLTRNTNSAPSRSTTPSTATLGSPPRRWSCTRPAAATG